MEHPDAQVKGKLADLQAAAQNELDAARREFEGAQNRLREIEDYMAALSGTIQHHNAKGN